MIIEVIKGTLRMMPESEAEKHQLKAVAAQIETESFANARVYQWELKSLTVPLVLASEYDEHQTRSLNTAAHTTRTILD